VSPRSPGRRPARRAPPAPEQRDELGVTVYSGGFGLIRETRTLALGKGRSEVEFGGVAGTIQPETVQIHAVGSAPGMHVLEQNYQYDLLTPAKLLEKYVGRTVRVLRWSETKGPTRSARSCSRPESRRSCASATRSPGRFRDASRSPRSRRR
jgi:hypothetical protein